MERRKLRARLEVSSGETGDLRPRRSSRLKGAGRRPLVEDPDVSDSESRTEMEPEDSHLPPAGDAVEEGKDARVPWSCAVVLDRLSPDEEGAARDLEEPEEMSRRGGKTLVSRIPTFQSSLGKKRPPAGGSHGAESPLPRKDPPAPSADVPKSKLPGAREPSAAAAAAPPHHHHQPISGLLPRSGLDPAPPGASAEPAPALPLPEGPRAPEPYQYLTLTPRPVLRATARVQEVSPEPAQEPEEAPPLGLTGARGEEAAHAGWTGLRPSGDGDTLGYREDVTPPAAAAAKELWDAARAINIADELPPWVAEPGRYGPALEEPEGGEAEVQEPRQLEDPQPVRDPQPIADPQPVRDPEPVGTLPVRDAEAEKPSAVRSASESVAENGSGRRQRAPQAEGLRRRAAPAEVRSELPKAPQPPAGSQRKKPAAPERSSPAAKRSGCCSFVLFCLLPAAMLLVGGAVQHAWRYGLPRSTDRLLAQLELQRLEGLEGWGLAGEPCSADCRVRLVESVPVGLYPSEPPGPLPSVADGWLRLLGRASGSLQIAGFYVTLRDQEAADPADAQGRAVFQELSRLPARGVQLQVAVNAPQSSTVDTAALAAAGAEVREVDLQAVSGGILHTKLWVVDQQHLYLGSANMDWRSLSQVKEVGVSVEDCSCLAQDAARIFGVYWSLGAEKNVSLPPYWPARLSALSSAQQPLTLRLNGVPARVYLSTAPPQISARGRTDDLWAILSVIADARSFVHISVMDFLPFSEYSVPGRFWPAIDSALREAACARGVDVKLLVSCWPHSSRAMFVFLQSLRVLHRPPLGCRVDVKVFTVPSTPEQLKIPYARVNHAKYMVTDRVAYIGTSNWSENYFVHTAGVGLVVNQTGSAVGPGQATLQAQLDQVFVRDWSSSYASELPDDQTDVCPPTHH